MKQTVTTGIVLARTEYGEADRIVTLLTPDQGKIRVLARGVRKIKSKLAGGIELFSVSNITVMAGRGELQTLLSARLIKHYGNIVSDIDRVQLGYELIKLLHKNTEDNPEADYFDLLEQAFEALNDAKVPRELILIWFQAQLMRLAGISPNLHQTSDGLALKINTSYIFDVGDMAFSEHSSGKFQSTEIKFLRLLFSEVKVGTLANVQDVVAFVEKSSGLVSATMQRITI
jgi:DNA repair protein RecO